MEVHWSFDSGLFSDGSDRGVVVDFKKGSRTILKTRTITGKTIGLTGGQYSASGTIVFYGFSFKFENMDFPLERGGAAHSMWEMTASGSGRSLSPHDAPLHAPANARHPACRGVPWRAVACRACRAVPCHTIARVSHMSRHVIG